MFVVDKQLSLEIRRILFAIRKIRRLPSKLRNAITRLMPTWEKMNKGLKSINYKVKNPSYCQHYKQRGWDSSGADEGW